MKRKNEKGFTLVELIVVMAVLAVISAIAVPRFLGVQEDAKLEADYATAAMLGKAAELYLVNADGTTVSVGVLNAVTTAEELQGLLKTTKIDFVSESFDGNEGKIDFEEGTNGEVIVSAPIGAATELTKMYPR